MAENLLDVGPPNSKRPKLNSPALSASDGPGKGPKPSAYVSTINSNIYTLDCCVILFLKWTIHKRSSGTELKVLGSDRCAKLLVRSSFRGYAAGLRLVLW